MKNFETEYMESTNCSVALLGCNRLVVFDFGTDIVK